MDDKLGFFEGRPHPHSLLVLKCNHVFVVFDPIPYRPFGNFAPPSNSADRPFLGLLLRSVLDNFNLLSNRVLRTRLVGLLLWRRSRREGLLLQWHRQERNGRGRYLEIMIEVHRPISLVIGDRYTVLFLLSLVISCSDLLR